MSGKNRNRNDKRHRNNATYSSACLADANLSSTLSELSVNESRFSSYARDSLQQMRDALTNPFGRVAREAVPGFHQHVTTFPRNGNINLEECSLLLQASTKILSKQVKEASSFISELAAFVTNTTKPDNDDNDEEGETTKEKKGRKKKDVVENGEPSSSSVINESQDSRITNEESTIPPLESVLPEGSQLENTSITDNSGSSSNTMNESGAATTLSPESSFLESLGMTQDSATTTGTDMNGTSETLNHENSLTELDGSDPMMMSTISAVQSGDNNDSTIDPSLNSSNEFCDNSDSVTTTGDSILQSLGGENDNSIPNNDTQNSTIPSNPKNLRKSRESGHETPRKKSKLSTPLNPPYLTSIIDIDNAMETDEDSDYDEYPPILFPEVDLWNGQFDLQADPDAPPKSIMQPPPPPPPATSLNDELTQRISEGLDHDMDDNNNNNMEIDLPPTQPLDGQETTPILDSTANLLTNIPLLNGVTSVSNLEFPTLSPEDQQEIQNCINQLHYLPFTCELSTEELERTFRNTVDKLETIFKKYNLPFNRSLLTAASAVCANMVKSTLKNAENNHQEQPHEERGENVREIFSQGADGMQASTLEALINSTQTIFERTKEKSVAESKATIQNRLKEMQRLIVPKYIQLPLIQENTPEFFRRVKQFEQKMKKVLADEETKESFDVSKYEIEVLQATAREAQAEEILDLDESGDETITSRLSEDSSMDDSIENHQNPCSPSTVPHLVMRSPSIASNAPSSSCDFNTKWVPLSHVFNHMKKFDRNECARHFYAVLALLSSQNLDMNYDRHYSEESAKVVTTKKDDSQDSKYPRGVKIMTSRCPDADKEEIYVTALASKSCNETFRDLISQEMNLHDNQHRGNTQGANVSNSSDHNSDSDNEFVTVNCTNLTSISGNLFGRRKKKRTN